MHADRFTPRYDDEIDPTLLTDIERNSDFSVFIYKANNVTKVPFESAVNGDCSGDGGVSITFSTQVRLDCDTVGFLVSGVKLNDGIQMVVTNTGGTYDTGAAFGVSCSSGTTTVESYSVTADGDIPTPTPLSGPRGYTQHSGLVQLVAFQTVNTSDIPTLTWPDSHFGQIPLYQLWPNSGIDEKSENNGDVTYLNDTTTVVRFVMEGKLYQGKLPRTIRRSTVTGTLADTYDDTQTEHKVLDTPINGLPIFNGSTNEWEFSPGWYPTDSHLVAEGDI